jgi:hypothetical protein
MILLALLQTALAVPPLVVAADEAETGLRAWWREGDLMVGPAEGDPRPAVRPLAGAAPSVLPENMDDWKPLLALCTPQPPPVAFALGEGRATALVTPTAGTLVVRVRVEDRVVAEGALGRPAVPCSLTVGQADTLPGQEVMLGWQTPAGVSGLTVFRIPDTAR